MLPNQGLGAVTALVEEDVDIAVEWIHAKLSVSDSSEAVELTTEFDGLSRDGYVLRSLVCHPRSVAVVNCGFQMGSTGQSPR